MLGHSFHTASRPEKKKQIMWIILGGTVAMPFLPGWFEAARDSSLFFTSARPLPMIYFALMSTLFFSSIFLALLRYRLMDLKILIRRGLAYCLGGGIIVLFFMLVFGISSRLFKLLAAESDLAAYIASALVVSFLFRPLLSKVDRTIGWIFTPEKYALRQALESVMQELIPLRNPREIFQRVYQTVAETRRDKANHPCGEHSQKHLPRDQDPSRNRLGVQTMVEATRDVEQWRNKRTCRCGKS